MMMRIYLLATNKYQEKIKSPDKREKNIFIIVINICICMTLST